MPIPERIIPPKATRKCAHGTHMISAAAATDLAKLADMAEKIVKLPTLLPSLIVTACQTSNIYTLKRHIS